MNVNVTAQFIELLNRKKIVLSYAAVDKQIFFPVANRVEQYAAIYNARNIITIGAFSASHSTILDPRLIEVGRYSTIEGNVKITNSQPPLQYLTTSTVLYAPSAIQNIDNSNDAVITTHHLEPRKVSIGHDVLIEQDCILTTGITIQTGAVVKAGSVVVSDVPSYAIVQGNPAMVVGWRFNESTRERLLASHWWQYNIYDLAYLNVTQMEVFLDKLDANCAHLTAMPIQTLSWDEAMIYSLEPQDSGARQRYYQDLAWEFLQAGDTLMAEDLRQRSY